MLEKQYFIPEPEEFIAETPMTQALKEIKKERDRRADPVPTVLLYHIICDKSMP